MTTERYSMSDVAYDIEQLYIEGYKPKSIAVQLEIPLSMVYDWIESNGVTSEEDVVEEPQNEIYSPYNGA